MMDKRGGIWDLDLNDACGGNAKIKTCRLAIDKKIEEFKFNKIG